MSEPRRLSEIFKNFAIKSKRIDLDNEPKGLWAPYAYLNYSPEELQEIKRQTLELIDNSAMQVDEKKPTGITLTPFTAPDKPSRQFIQTLKDIGVDSQTIKIAERKS